MGQSIPTTEVEALAHVVLAGWSEYPWDLAPESYKIDSRREASEIMKYLLLNGWQKVSPPA